MTNAVRSIQTQRLMTIGALGLMALMISEPSFAGTGGDAFTDVWDTLKDWTQGTLGRIVAGAMVLVGIVGGIARQSLMAFALGIGGGMGLYNTPTVVESVMSATFYLSLPALKKSLAQQFQQSAPSYWAPECEPQ